MARILIVDGDAKGAVNKMRDAYNIFLAELGASDRNTKEAESWLEQLTQNAVSIAKQAKLLQSRRIGGLRHLPRMGMGTRLQPQSASTAVPNTGARTGASELTLRTGTGGVAMDSRSIDDLLKFIEGGDAASSPRTKKKKSMNPKARGTRKTVT